MGSQCGASHGLGEFKLSHWHQIVVGPGSGVGFASGILNHWRYQSSKGRTKGGSFKF